MTCELHLFSGDGLRLIAATRQSLLLLSHRDRRLLYIAIALQMTLSALDLIGVLLFGLVGAMAVSVVQSAPLPPVVLSVQESLGLQDLSPQAMVALIATVAAVALLAKSILNFLLTRRLFRFLANRQALVSARLASEFFTLDLKGIKAKSTQEMTYALTTGASAATTGLLGGLVILVSETSLLLVLAVGLLFIDPLITLGAIAFFALVALALQRLLGTWAQRLSKENSVTDIQSLELIQEATASFRELTVLDRGGLYVERFQALRWRAAKILADREILGQIPKYVLDVSLIVGGLALGAALFTTRDAVAAMGTLALFLVAASRVMPSLLRLQTASLLMRGSEGAAAPTFELKEFLDNHAQAYRWNLSWATASNADIVREKPINPFVPAVELARVTVSYPGSQAPALKDISLTIPPGSSLAVVGSSGAGKSTLADVLLGLLRPDSGQVLISGVPPLEAFSTWPGCVGYVPQEVALGNASLRANIGMGLPVETINDEAVWQALEDASLLEWATSTGEGLDRLVGERGGSLSGGQRQRVGIARALYSSPRLLIMDEATSALDALTERQINETVFGLSRDVTIVVIAHRLSSVLSANQLAFLDAGQLVATGSFSELRESVPKFREMALAMGL